jgi:predicted  nucleic acid-binding Zn-ribbon protein
MADPWEEFAKVFAAVEDHIADTKSAEGEEGATTQTNAPSSIQELMKENEILRRRNAYLEGDLKEISKMLGKARDDLTELAEAHIDLKHELLARKSDWFYRDEEQDEYTVEILPATKH